VKAFWEIFRLTLLEQVRSRALPLLMVASVVWMFAAPHVFCSDGTAAGARELGVRFSLGGVAALVAVTLLVSAAGALSRERAEKRLQLTMVRPVRLWAIALGKIVALSTIGALVLACAAVVEFARQDASRTCSSVYHPVLPSPAAEAAAMYEAYMADPATPPEVKKARKSVVIRLLTQKAIDHYQTVGTNETATWEFRPSAHGTQLPSYALRFRFTNLYEMRDEVHGRIVAGNCGAIVSNITQAIVTIPLDPLDARPQDAMPRAPALCPLALSFSNDGARPVMLRPRKDVELLVAADSFAMNLLRAWLQLVGMVTLLVAFGVFLGATLSRSVAVFVAIVALALCEMSPSVLEQYPDALEKDRADAVGLALARFSAAVTHPVGSLRPLAALAADERIEPTDVARTLATDVLILPVVFALLAALLMPRKQDEL